jgi:ABC-type multidrug transport system fused ATPase/permease subunit
MRGDATQYDAFFSYHWRDRDQVEAIARVLHERDIRVFHTWVDLRRGIDDTEAIETLASGIRGEPPGPDLQPQLMQALADICPYRGLLKFREEDAPFFFGREKFAERLLEAVSRQSFVAVVGASGSGKSSVVQAGLIPRLRRIGAGLVWDMVSLVPGNRPLGSLAEALMPLLEPALS